MTARYFDRFPIIEYDGYRVRDLAANARVVDRFVGRPFSFSESTMASPMRPDVVADRVYSDPYFSWLLFLTNGVIDPVGEWYRGNDDFDAYLRAKYGSVAAAQRRLWVYRTNWYADPREVSTVVYDGLDADVRRYWEPVYDDAGTVSSYRRRRTDVTVNTNRLVRVGIANNDAGLLRGSLVDAANGSNAVTGSAEVRWASDDALVLCDVVGTIANGYTLRVFDEPTSYVTIDAYSSEDDVTADAWTVVNIPDDEFVYWERVTVHDMETEMNELRRDLRTVDPRMAQRLDQELTAELAG